MPFISKIQRQTDYSLFSPSCPIVIDNGGSYFRIGWAGESDPRVIFRNIVQRPRHKVTGETVTVVGDHGPALLKYFDCMRSTPRSAFDFNVVFQFETMESILDFGFDRLGVNGSEVDHPVLITECPCNPLHSRFKMAELLFESYGVPSVAFGVDAAFSYTYNQRLGVCNMEGLAISSGFNTSHVVPFVNGEPVYDSCCRTNVGGFHVTDYLKQLLSLKYPHVMSMFTWEKVEDLKMEHCYIATDYFVEARLFQNGTKESEKKTRYWQIPYTPPPVEEQLPSGEDVARKAALKEKQGQRLREMAESRRVLRITELENELRGLEFLLRQLEKVDEMDVPAFLSDTGYISKLEIESSVAKVTQSLRKAKREQVESEEREDAASSEKYPLIDVPDKMLSPEQLKDKKRQQFLKTTAEGRQRARHKRFEEEALRDRENQLEEEMRLENPELYLEQLHARHKELIERVEQRKRLKTNENGYSSNRNGYSSNGNSCGVGRGERLNATQKERMHLLTMSAFDRDKGDDTFGAKDDDWELYKLMSKDHDDEDEGPDEDELELSRLSSKLQVLDPSFVLKLEFAESQPFDVPKPRLLTEEDFKISLGVERFRCPEVLFRPNLLGIDQVGLDEMVGVSVRRFTLKGQGFEETLTSSILLTGGSCLYPGMAERLEAGVRMILPCGTPIRIVRALDPVMDAWRGASTFAASLCFPSQTFSKMDYDERGEVGLHGYKFRYTI
ncbi:hypothetical protein Drorol1_Dr00024263 [Drosera rotundifolia]